MSHHSGDIELSNAVQAVMIGLEELTADQDLCIECFLGSLVLSLCATIKENGFMSEDAMEETASNVVAILSGEATIEIMSKYMN